MLVQEIDEDPEVNHAFRISVDRGIQEGAVAVDFAGGARQGAVENIEHAGEGQHHAPHEQLTHGDQERPHTGDEQPEQGEHVGRDRRIAKHADGSLGPAPHPGLEFLGKHQRGLRLGSSRTAGAGWAESMACR